MEEVVVSATKTEEKRRDIPNAVIIIDQEDMKTAPGNNIAEYLANEPGIDFRTFGDYGGSNQEIHLRGMGGPATQLLVNGVRYNSPSLGLANAAKVIINAVDRVEVVKGAGSLLYGSGAMGGTVSLMTKKPSRSGTIAKVEAGYGTQDSYRLEAERGMYLNDYLGYYMTSSYTKTDGFRDNSGLERTDASIHFVFEKNESLHLSLYSDFLNRNYGVPGVVPPASTIENPVNHVPPFTNNEAAGLLDHGKDEDLHLIIKAQGNPFSWLTYSISTDLSHQDNMHHARYASSGGGNETNTTNNILGAEANIEFKPFREASLLLGVDYDHFDWGNNQVAIDTSDQPDEGSRNITSKKAQTIGSFIEAQYRTCQYLKILAGLRHQDNSSFGTKNLPMAGLVVNLHDTNTIKLSHGRHFLAPTMNDLFWPGDIWTEGNPNLEPETGHHTDLTIEQALLNDRIFLTGSYFNWDLNDKILWGLDTDWIYRPNNLDSYEADGLELGVKIGPFLNMNASLSYTYTDAEEKVTHDAGITTRAASYVPENKLKAGLTWWSDFGLTASAVINYVGDRPYYGTDKTITSSSDTLESYWTVDFKAEQQLLDNMKLTLQAMNLFDEEYNTFFGAFFDPVTFASSLGTYPGAGRSVFVSVSYEY